MIEIYRCYMSNHGPVFDMTSGTYVITDTEVFAQYIIKHGHRSEFGRKKQEGKK